MFKSLKQMFQKKNVGEITVKVNLDTTEAEEIINELVEQGHNVSDAMNELSHIKLVTNDDNVPELYINGVKADSIVDVKYHWHTADDKYPHRYDIDVTYYVGDFEHHETIKDIVHAQMDRAAFESMLTGLKSDKIRE